MKKLSVIIPVYNVLPYVKKCIESAKANEYENLEIIVVDDGSTDGSSEVCDRCAAEDDRVVIIHKRNGGTATARKMGVAVSSGDYITFIDGDDWVEKTMYSSLMGIIDKTECDIIISGMYRDEDGVTKSKWKSAYFEEGLYEKDKCIDLRRNLFKHGMNMINGHCGNKIFRRSLLIPFVMNMDDENTGIEDDNFTLSSILAANSIFILHQCFYHGVERKGSVVHRLHKDYYYQMHIALHNYTQMARVFDENTFQYEVAKTFLFRLLTGIGHVFEGVKFPRFIWKEAALFHGKKIVLYGGGVVGESYNSFIECDDCIQLVAWIDKYRRYSIETNTVLKELDVLNDIDYDALVICVEDKNVSKEITTELNELGVDKDRIFWSEPIYIVDLLMKKNTNNDTDLSRHSC